MITAKQRENDFRSDFEKLLKKHGAEFQITDDGKPFGFHSAIAVINIDGVYKNGETVAEYTEFRL